MASAAAKSGHAAEASHAQRGFIANSSQVYSKIKPRKVVVYEERLLIDARREGGLCRGEGKLNTTLPNLIPYFSIITSWSSSGPFQIAQLNSAPHMTPYET